MKKKVIIKRLIKKEKCALYQLPIVDPWPLLKFGNPLRFDPLSFLSLGGDIRLNQLMVNDKVSAKKSIDLKVS